MAFQEYLTANAHIAYPFAEDALGLAPNGDVVGSSSLLPTNVFVDAQVSIPVSLQGTFFGLISITSNKTSFAEVFPDEGHITFTFGSPGGYQFSQSIWVRYLVGTPYSVFTLSALHMGELVQVKLVINYPAFMSYLLPLTTTDFSDTLPFEQRVLCYRTDRLTQLRIYNEGVYSDWFQGDVLLKSGYNMSQVVVGNAITLAAIPGAGQGKVPCVEAAETGEVRMPLGGLVPDADGNINIVAAENSVLTLDETLSGDTMTLTIQNAGQPCCQCQDYLNVANAINRIMAELKDARDKLALTQCGTSGESYCEGVEKYNTDLISKFAVAKVTVTIIPGSKSHNGPYTNVKTSAPYEARVYVTITNRSGVDIKMTSGATLSVSVETAGFTPGVSKIVRAAPGASGTAEFGLGSSLSSALNGVVLKHKETCTVMLHYQPSSPIDPKDTPLPTKWTVSDVSIPYDKPASGGTAQDPMTATGITVDVP